MTFAGDAFPKRFLAIQEGTRFMGRQLTPCEVEGFLGFFANGDGRSTAVTPTEFEEYRMGRELGRRTAYAQGALASAADQEGKAAAPYKQFSPAWNAWAEGYDAHAHLALNI